MIKTIKKPIFVTKYDYNTEMIISLVKNIM